MSETRARRSPSAQQLLEAKRIAHELAQRLKNDGYGDDYPLLVDTLEGQTTAHYIAERIERFPVRVTQLAHGLPVGGELDYLDEGTLAQALRARRPVG